MTLVFDIGGTNIRAALVSKTKIENRLQVPTPKARKELIEKIIDIVSKFPKQKTINFSVPGFEYKGKIQNSPNLDIEKMPLRKILEQKLRTKINLENDAKCAGLAELHFGEGKNLTNFVFLTLGTGIGGAIIINKKLYKGFGGAGEVGEMIINREKRLEHLASGTAVKTISKEFGFREISNSELKNLASRGNQKALAIYKKIGHYLGIGFSNIAYILSPEAIILGGGFSSVKYIYPEAKNSFNKHFKTEPKPKILKSKFGDDAGLIGAALL